MTATSLIGQLHGKHVFKRRIQALARTLGPQLKHGSVLDVGCGDGQLAALLMKERNDLQITGIDVYVREQSFIPVIQFDGRSIPFADDSFSNVLIVDVLHHTDEPAKVLKECLRVSPRVVVKDHFYTSPFDYLMLRMMDWVGNAPHGVRLPYNYFSRETWRSTLVSIGAKESDLRTEVHGLYPQPAQALIGRRIQFTSVLTR